MQGLLDHDELEGITPRIIKSIFQHISNASEENQYIVQSPESPCRTKKTRG